jgi:hypothetical protein
MDMKNRIWFLVLDDGSMLSKTIGAYKLKTIMKCKEKLRLQSGRRGVVRGKETF